MNAKTEAAVIEHGKNLLAIFPNATEKDPVKLCKKLRRLEWEGAALALRRCNGPEFAEGQYEAKTADVLAKVDGLLHYERDHVRVFLNGDPRGYALKIDDDWMRARPDVRLHRDWGDYGILAPDLTEK